MEELKEILEKNDRFYIFGAGIVAQRIYKLIKKAAGNEKIQGFIVSSLKNNPTDIEGKTVYEINSRFINKTVPVLVTVSESYHADVYEMLANKGFHEVISVYRFYGFDISDGEKYAVDVNAHLVNPGMAMDGDLMAFTNKLVHDYLQADHAFGGGTFYQSLPRIGIKGDRPSDIRIEKYKLDRYLDTDTCVLDIGCNVGFFDIEISDNVKSVTGIDYAASLVQTGQCVADKLKIKNVRFICADYNHWVKENLDKYGLILSFAVHCWLDVSPVEYARQIDKILLSGGHLIFESQTYEGDKKKFMEFVNAFKDAGLKMVDDDLIMDDGKTNRRFVVFEKQEGNKQRESSITGRRYGNEDIGGI